MTTGRRERGSVVLAWLAACSLSLVSGCSFESAPSLGRAGSLRTGRDAGANADAATSNNDASNSAARDADTPSRDERDAGRNTDGATSPANDASARVCRPGVYTGVFSCTTSVINAPPITTTTEVSIALKPSASGSSLVVDSANLSLAAGGFVINGNVIGELDCETGSFHAELMDAAVTFTLLLLLVPIAGLIEGQLDDSGTSLSGDWSLVAITAENCSGPWQLSLQP